MESSLYDLGLAADWSLELFPGQLLTNGAEASGDPGWLVLQEGCPGEGNGEFPAPGQYSAVESPMSEPLQDSIWSECGDVLGLAQLSGFGQKGLVESLADNDDCLQFVTHHELTLLTPDLCPYPSTSHKPARSDDIYPLTSSSIDDVKFEYTDISTVDELVSFPLTHPLGVDGYRAGRLCGAACDEDGPISLELQEVPSEIPAELDLGLEPALDLGSALDLGQVLDPGLASALELGQALDPSLTKALDLGPALDLGLIPACMLHDEQILHMLWRFKQQQQSGLTLLAGLSPVSAEDCESVLTSDYVPSGGDTYDVTPPSPAESGVCGAESLADSDSSYTTLSSSDYLQTCLMPKAQSHRSTTAAYDTTPYGATAASYGARALKSEHRRLKKKEQNKTAALRYRVKKREEKGVVLTEVEALELKNDELRARSDDLQRELDYLRALLDEIRRP